MGRRVFVCVHFSAVLLSSAPAPPSLPSKGELKDTRAHAGTGTYIRTHTDGPPGCRSPYSPARQGVSHRRYTPPDLRVRHGASLRGGLSLSREDKDVARELQIS